ncbi:hypothetical protein CHS0354_015027 [Potamilus streckersoni]|uniref:Lipase domain-containing protein n=1 Tax=Potamilus streckersoni TaxID=2493646 RepID=A0AAE0T1U3_9BIVA|nr:hypothetical protein CHS0354_015027 [Potamilus streckersoni]
MVIDSQILKVRSFYKSTNIRNLLIFNQEDANVILVNWIKGARLANYAQVAANTRVVGALLSVLMEALIGVAPEGYSKRMHLIGHSLGAHVAGYAGERIQETGRITGLDPAGPFFEDTEPKVRLDPTDAEFVDVIHTDRTCFGISSSIGHVDFYPNGGKNQPGCKDQITDLVCDVISGTIKDIGVTIACSHMRSLWLFIESINSNCWFFSFPSEYATTCDSVCAIMGYDALSGDPRGDYYLPTQSFQPFCSEYCSKITRLDLGIIRDHF